MAISYSQELADRICSDLASGMTLRAVCRQEGMPAPSTVIKWALEDRGGFHEQYARAREIGYHVMADDIFDIADDGSNDWLERELESGRIEEVPNHEHITRSRLRVDTRKWALSKALPKIYGDKIQTQQLGKDGQPVDPANIQPIINVTVAKDE